MRKLEIIIILTLVAAIGGFAYWISKDNHVDIEEKGQTVLSPTQIKSIESIGQWEFLSVTDEELIDTTRHGFFGDDQLVRIYYGTLRLGIDMRDAPEEWIKAEGDTIRCTLPPIKLLDNNFIDEAKTRSFFESGKWTGKDRQAMYDRAYVAMKARCLSNANIDKAKANALSQFSHLLKTMGFAQVKVMFEEPE